MMVHVNEIVNKYNISLSTLKNWRCGLTQTKNGTKYSYSPVMEPHEWEYRIVNGRSKLYIDEEAVRKYLGLS